MKNKKNIYVLLLSCPDKIGIVSNVASFLLSIKCNIIESGQFSDPKNGNFFMRICFQDINNKEININKITKQFRNINIKYKMKSKFYNLSKKSKIIIMVSKFGHCLY